MTRTSKQRARRTARAMIAPAVHLHESASTNVDYWKERYPALIKTMSGATGKAVHDVCLILVGYARTPLTTDGEATVRFMREHVAP